MGRLCWNVLGRSPKAMDPDQGELLRLLKSAGAVLERKRKHCVWRLSDGSIFVHAATPSDSHAWANALREFRRLRGLNPPDRGLEGPRRERKGNRQTAKPPVLATFATVRARSLAEQLAGVKIWEQDEHIFATPIAEPQRVDRPDPTVYEAIPRILDVPEMATEAKCPSHLIPTSLPRLQGPASAPRSPFLRRLLDWLW